MRRHSTSTIILFFLLFHSMTACNAPTEADQSETLASPSRPTVENVATDAPPEPSIQTEFPNWTSITNANFIHQITFDHMGSLWAVGGGGAVQWDVRDGTYVKITSEYGLAENHVTSLAVANDGSLWFGTDGSGVSHYDGEAWVHYTESDGIAANAIHAIAVSQDDVVWIATSEGLSRFDGDQWTTLTTADGLRSNVVYSLHIDADDTLWAGTNQGLSHFDGAKWVNYHTEDGLAGSLVRAITEASDGSMWIGTQDGGVSYFDGDGWITYTESEGLPSNWILSIAVSPKGAIWVGTRKGLARFDGQIWIASGEGSELAHTPVTSLAIDENDDVWAATDGKGVFHEENGTWTTYRTKDGLPSNDVESLALASDGSLLVATGDGSISLLEGQTWKTFSWKDRPVIPLPFGPQESLWFVHEDGGVASFDGEMWRTFTHPDLAGTMVTSVATTEDGSIWISTLGKGVYAFYQDNWSHYTSEDGLAHDRVTCSASSREGGLWFGTESNGVSRYQNDVWSTFTADDGLRSNSISSITVSSNGIVWIGTDAGISKLEGDVWTSYTGGEISGVRELYASNEPDGVLWVGAANGVLSFDWEQWLSFPPSLGIAGNWVQSIVETDHGFLWFGTLQAGLSRYFTSIFQWQGVEADGVREVRLIDVKEIWTTTGSYGGVSQGTQYLQFGSNEMQWSESSPGTGFLYMSDPQTSFSMWEFAPTDKAEITEVEMAEIHGRFYGKYDSAGEQAFGRYWGESAIRVSLGQVLLARTIEDPYSVYVIKIANIEGRTVEVEYTVVERTR